MKIIEIFRVVFIRKKSSTTTRYFNQSTLIAFGYDAQFPSDKLYGLCLVYPINQSRLCSMKTKTFNGNCVLNLTDREYFILHYLRKGLIEKFSVLGQETLLESKFSSKFSQLVEPKNFSLNLLDWTEEKFEIKDDDVIEIVQHNKVCLESGKCVEPRDVGSNCCLF